ncbi:MAG TPA: glycosyltransferase 87 family protein, partial [Acidimicrobiales bacterium]|nr:glycosyltransferase 87 family protein [Acidimicrobiales bacterium]
MRDLVRAWWRRVSSLTALEQDAVLYLVASCFAAVVALTALSSDYRFWGDVDAPVYLVAAAACALVARSVRRSSAFAEEDSSWPGRRQAARRGAARDPVRWSAWTRRAVVVFLLLAAVVLPLVAELASPSNGRPGADAQPEVAVIQQAGDRAAAHRDPYPSAPDSYSVTPQNDPSGPDESSFFPYLPGMVPFGLVNSISGPRELRDARVALAGFTLLVVALVLAYPGTTIGRRGRALQFLVVLPTGSLPMVTGGDDLPVLALMLLGLVLAERRRPVLAGLALGLDATLKLTAWPVLLLMLLAVRDRKDRPAALRYAVAAGAILLPVLGVAIALDPGSFVLNVVRFPLGLTKVKSPAASPLLGQVLVTLLPHEKRLITVVLVVAGLAVVLEALRRHPPRTPAQVARFTCFAM